MSLQTEEELLKAREAKEGHKLSVSSEKTLKEVNF